MKPPINFRNCFTAVIFTGFLFLPFSSREAGTKAIKSNSIISVTIDAASAANIAGNFNLTMSVAPMQKGGHHSPADTKKEGQHDEMKKGKTHADEEKHKNHLYHYTRVKRKKKSHTIVICLALKIFIAISYISVLICGYLSICH